MSVYPVKGFMNNFRLLRYNKIHLTEPDITNRQKSIKLPL